MGVSSAVTPRAPRPNLRQDCRVQHHHRFSIAGECVSNLLVRMLLVKAASLRDVACGRGSSGRLACSPPSDTPHERRTVAHLPPS